MAKLFLLLAAPLAFAGFTVPAAAEENGERHTVIVRYDDLNLSSVDGRKRLTTRVKLAVEKVCGIRDDYRQMLGVRAIAQRCQDSTMADADLKLAGLFNGSGTALADRGGIVIVAAP